MATDDQIEQRLQALGKTAPRITPEDIENAIEREYSFRLGDGVYGAAAVAGDHASQQFPASFDTTTVVVLVLKNGFNVIGTSAVVSVENFDPEVGRAIARKKATDQLWSLMGFALCDRRYLQPATEHKA